MKFALIDRIVAISPPQHVSAVKAVSASEEYLADHFPTFPVLPGVFMLETMVEAATWLVRASRDFDVAVLLLRDVRNVIYKSFVKPGHLLEVDVTCRRMSADESDFVGVGRCEGKDVVKGRFGLSHYGLARHDPTLADVEHDLLLGLKKRYATLVGSSSAE